MNTPQVLLAIASLILGVAATFGLKATLDNRRQTPWWRRFRHG
jgi:hypothetical protein